MRLKTTHIGKHDANGQVAVNCAGFEPAASALSRQRSEPAELTIRCCKFKKKYTYLKAIRKELKINFMNCSADSFN